MALNIFKKSKKAKAKEELNDPTEAAASDDVEAEPSGIKLEGNEPSQEVPAQETLVDPTETADGEPYEHKPDDTTADNFESVAKPKSGTGIFGRLKKGLAKTRDFLNADVDDLFSGGRKVDDDLLEDLEEMLITADIGVATAMMLMDKVRESAKSIKNAKDMKKILKDEVSAILSRAIPDEKTETNAPHVILVLGVNGVGKTTTIGKLASKYASQGKKVLVAAGDTFRAAAVEQLTVWADRSGAEIVKHKENSDPAAVAFDGVSAAKARGVDVVLVDTAGRLHTRVNLMKELKKIQRAITKVIPDAPHETLLVVDASTGQNAVNQAKMFNDEFGVSAIALTKLDGTAKGGIVVAIADSLEIPLKYIGVGEAIEDLQEFDPEQFADAMF